MFKFYCLDKLLRGLKSWHIIFSPHSQLVLLSFKSGDENKFELFALKEDWEF